MHAEHPIGTDRETQKENPASRTITGLHENKTGKVSNKWSSYLGYYDQLFAPLQDAPLKILEIGIQNGGSLETWGQYFKNAETIVGCDIDPKCAALRFDDPRIHVLVGDANSQAIYSGLIRHGPFDVVIDDGSHLSEDILVSFLNYFPLLKPGGIFVVEDTHAVYHRPQTSIHNRQTALGFFRDLTDVVNYQFWHQDQSIDALLGPYLSVAVPPFLKQGWVESIAFRNSIITIHKAMQPDHNKAGYMHVVGDTAEVDPTPLGVKLARASRS